MINLFTSSLEVGKPNVKRMNITATTAFLKVTPLVLLFVGGYVFENLVTFADLMFRHLWTNILLLKFWFRSFFQ